ncbi:MAG TPA: hypothetical protein VK177_02140 [Flavobacteriales bacterium]|nr:hypothetical protein [Flavobacteriales bacterium]
MRIALLSIIFAICIQGFSKDPAFRWTIATDPYRNHIYPGQTGVKYFLNYTYHMESREIRKFLKKNYDIKASASSLGKILKDVSNGSYFDRYFDVNIKYMQVKDTLFVKVKYENGDSTLEKYSGIRGMKMTIPLTRYKNQHDYATGTTKLPGQKGLVACVDIFVKSPAWSKDHVCVKTKLVTEAHLPGVVTKVRGRSFIKK